MRIKLRWGDGRTAVRNGQGYVIDTQTSYTLALSLPPTLPPLDGLNAITINGIEFSVNLLSAYIDEEDGRLMVQTLVVASKPAMESHLEVPVEEAVLPVNWRRYGL